MSTMLQLPTEKSIQNAINATEPIIIEASIFPVSQHQKHGSPTEPKLASENLKLHCKLYTIVFYTCHEEEKVIVASASR